MAIPVSDTVDIQPTDSAERVFGGIDGAGGPTDVFAIIGALADTLENGGDVGAAAATALGDLKASVDHLTGVRASIGPHGARPHLHQQPPEVGRASGEEREGQVVEISEV